MSVIVYERQREMWETEIKERKEEETEREEGSYRTIILGNWGVSVLLREMRCPTTGWFQALK